MDREEAIKEQGTVVVSVMSTIMEKTADYLMYSYIGQLYKKNADEEPVLVLHFTSQRHLHKNQVVKVYIKTILTEGYDRINTE